MQTLQSLQTAAAVFAQQPMLLGAWFGALHAFDADHMSAIGSMAVSNKSASAPSYAVHWALGHALALGLIGSAVLGLGYWGLTELSGYAEVLVALTLLGLGVHCLRGLARSRPPVAPASAARRLVRHRASVAMGLLHGGAGSAAVIAIAPLAAFQSLGQSAIYLGCFSLGVAGGACLFAQLFSRCLQRTQGASRKARVLFQASVGVFAIATSASLLLESWHGGS